jgi:hypothetical protein
LFSSKIPKAIAMALIMPKVPSALSGMTNTGGGEGDGEGDGEGGAVGEVVGDCVEEGEGEGDWDGEGDGLAFDDGEGEAPDEGDGEGDRDGEGDEVGEGEGLADGDELGEVPQLRIIATPRIETSKIMNSKISKALLFDIAAHLAIRVFAIYKFI